MTEVSDQPPAPLIWEVQRKPGPRASLVVYLIGIALVVGGGVFGAMIHLDRQPWFGLGVGLIMAILFVAGVRKGTVVRVDENGWLTLNMGAKDNLKLHLSQIEACILLNHPGNEHVGLRISDYRSVVFLHKSGVNFRKMAKNRQLLGVDIVLEHFNAEDLATLQELGQQFAATSEQAPEA